MTSKLTVKSLKCDPKNQPALPFNDLAVVELEESLNRPVIKLVRPEMALVRRMTLTALGWGRGNSVDNKLIEIILTALSDQHQTFDTGKSHLQQVRLKLMNQKKCEDSMHQRLPTMLCTLGHKGKDTCDVKISLTWLTHG